MTRLLIFVSLFLIIQLFCGCYNQYDRVREGEIFVSDKVYLNGKMTSTDYIITLLKKRKNDKNLNTVIINIGNQTRYKTLQRLVRVLHNNGFITKIRTVE